MTAEEFTAFYPQFTGFTPAVVLTGTIRRANGQFSSFTQEDAEEARRLYTAHQLTLYARTALPDGARYWLPPGRLRSGLRVKKSGRCRLLTQPPPPRHPAPARRNRRIYGKPRSGFSCWPFCGGTGEACMCPESNDDQA